ncbi:hypothetical protein FXB39_20500 [Nocardioides sp. BGMRC 2183]|nr:hypothetical protein FXB39_20500 [Nocardioides sp. BGMRC 2183]
MSFNVIDYYNAVLDIEKYLNYLKSNELAHEYAKAVIDANDLSSKGDLAELYTEVGISLRDWESPCPESRFKFRFHGGYAEISSVRVLMPFDYTQDEVDQIRREFETGLTEAWNNGASWADGLYEYVNDVSRQFVKPDVEVMAGAVHTLARDVTEELAIGAVDNWAYIEDLLNEWSGDSAHEFFGFYTRYGSALDLFSLMSMNVAAGFAASTRIISGTQQGALKFVESIRDSLETMLIAWVEVGGPPPDIEFPAWVADVAKIALDVWPLLQLIPSVKAATTTVDTMITAGKNISTLVTTISDVSNVELHKLDLNFDAKTSDEIYTQLTDTLYNDYYLKYVEAMDSFHDGSYTPDVDNADEIPFRGSLVVDRMEELQGGRNDWYLPEVHPESMYEDGDEYGW